MTFEYNVQVLADTVTTYGNLYTGFQQSREEQVG